MPELPDIVVYIDALTARIQGHVLQEIRIFSPFVLRSVDPPPSGLVGRSVIGIRRLGKQIAIELDGEFFIVVHLMIAGRFQWKEPAASPGKIGLAAFDFDSGTLLLTEAGSRKRASIHLARGEPALQAFDRRALEVLDCELEAFRSVLLSENHTLKRALTDPRLFSGIGNAFSDEILHASRLSPLKLTSRLGEEEIGRLWESTRKVLTEWTARLRAQTRENFPAKVTAFRPEMAVHGRFGKPCPVCGAPVQRIAYAENECNYCASCQTGGRLLADRAMSRLLKEDWPRSLDELEKHFETRRK